MLPPWLLPGTSSPGLTVFAAMCRNCPSAGARTTCPTARSTAWPALSLRRTPPAPPSPALMSPPSRCARVVAGLQAPARVHPPADALLAGGGAPVEGAQRGCSRTGASVRVPVVTCLHAPWHPGFFLPDPLGSLRTSRDPAMSPRSSCRRRCSAQRSLPPWACKCCPTPRPAPSTVCALCPGLPSHMSLRGRGRQPAFAADRRVIARLPCAASGLPRAVLGTAVSALLDPSPLGCSTLTMRRRAPPPGTSSPPRR